jgi:hypothetical protein
MIVDTSSSRFRRQYAALAQRSDDERRQEFRRGKLDCIDITTGESFVEPLVRFFRTREARR